MSNRIENPSKLVNYFISSSGLVKGIAYEVLVREELRLFKDNLINMGIEKYKRSPKLILFYESDITELINAKGDTPFSFRKYIANLTTLYKEGLLGFINYAHIQIGKEFKK